MIIKRNMIAFALSTLFLTTLGSTVVLASESKVNEKKKIENKKTEKKSVVIKAKDSKKRYKLGTKENPGKCGL